MRNSNIYRILILIASFIFLTACQISKVDTDKAENYKTDYVGDNNKVAKIASLQEYPKGYSYDHIEIQSDQEPYSLTVYLNIEKESDSIKIDLEPIGKSIFNLIGNLKTLNFVNAKTGYEIASFNR